MDEDQGRTKRTYILPNALLKRLERVAKQERRPVGRQLEILLERALDQQERREKEPGQRWPARLEQVPA